MKKHPFRTCAAATAVLVLGALSGVSQAASSSAAQAGTSASLRTVEGVVRVLASDTVEHATKDPHDHGFTGRSEDIYEQFLLVGDQAYKLGGRPLPPNTRVRVSGRLAGRTLTPSRVQVIRQEPPAIPSSGNTHVLVMLAHWNVPDSVTPASAQAQMFGDSANWYRDASYTRLGQTGDVTPWMQIAGPANGKCRADFINVMNQAKQGAVALGYNLSNYGNFVVYFPNNSWQAGSDCNGFAGWAFIGAEGTWLNGFMDRRATVHEQGHNYGLFHAHSYLCPGVVTGTCTFTEYGDDYDAMGASSLVGHFSAPAKSALGWMAGRTADLTAGGTATLAPLAADPLALKAAVVRVSTTRAYWLEYRQAIDFDGNLPFWATDGVQLRLTDPPLLGDPGAGLVDARPADGVSVDNATLQAFSSWTSPEGFRITVREVTPAGATVTVGDSDTTPPTVIATSPTDGGTGFPVAQSVTATFSEEVTAVTAMSFQLKTASSGALVPTTVTRNGSTNEWVADPDASLATDTLYTASLTGGPSAIRDLTGNVLAPVSWSFLTGPAPTATVDPRAGATGVNRSTKVTATFSEPVIGVGDATFTLRSAADGTTVEARLRSKGNKNQWVLDPRHRLDANTSYTATLTGGSTAIRDNAGNPFNTMSWTFTTRR